MSLETVIAPQVGESIKEVRILNWKKKDGDLVRSGEVLVEIETDKASVEVAANSSGKLQILRKAEETVGVGETLGKIDTSVKVELPAGKTPTLQTKIVGASATPTKAPAPPTVAGSAPSSAAAAVPSNGHAFRKDRDSFLNEAGQATAATAPSVETNKSSAIAPAAKAVAPQTPAEKLISGETRKPLSRLRLKIAENLIRAQNEFAILTTFNEVDLSEIMKIREKNKESFKKKNGVGLGFMSFFTRATCLAIKEQPLLNSSIDGTDMILRDFVNMGIAVGSERGLVVPVVKNADKMTFVEIETAIAAFAEKAKNNKLTLDDMSNGTFTISNGGVYGSMMSTPIINPPQSAILGMHNIVKRAVVVNDKIEIRPMMYLAVSYDHRIVDGKEAVTFLVSIKKRLENPAELKMDF